MTDTDNDQDEDLYEEALERFRQSSECESDNRRDALDDLKFARLGEQWPEEIRQDREKDRRPCLTINRMPTFIRQVVNDSRQNKPSIKVHPVDDEADPETADILNGLIRNIEVISDADIAYDTAIESAVSGGFGYFRIITDYAHDDAFDLDILIRRIANPFTVYGDHRTTSADGSDWNYAFVTEWLEPEEFKKRWPGVDVKAWKEGIAGDESEHWTQDDRVRVAEYWVREEIERTLIKLSDGSVWDADEIDEERMAMLATQGIAPEAERVTKSWKVTQHWIGGGEVLESVDWPGRYIPIVPVYGDEVNIEGKRHLLSLIRFAKDPQRMFNYWRTNATEMVGLAPKAPWVGAVGQFDSEPGKWATANVETHQYLEYDPVDGAPPPQRQPYAGPPAGALQEAMSASDDMKSAIGIYDASLGARSNETSGVAINARKREGDVSTFHFIDNMTRAIRQAGRILVDLIPKVYSGPRMLRVLGEDMKPQVVPVNQPQQPQGMPGQPPSDPVQKLFNLTVGKYDVTVKAGPSFTTQREEFAASVTEMIRAYPPAAPILMDMIAKAQDWPEAEKVAARLHAMLPPPILAMEQAANGGPPPIPPQVQQQMQQMQQALQQLQNENGQLKAKVQSGEIDLQKSVMDLQGKQMDAGIKGQELEIAKVNATAKGAEAQARMVEAINRGQQPYQAPQGDFATQ